MMLPQIVDRLSPKKSRQTPPMSSDPDRNHSLVLGEVALGHIKSHGIAAVPRNYAIWYNYTAGGNPRLRDALQAAMSREETLSQSELDAIFSTFFSQERIQDSIDASGMQFSATVGTIVQSLDEAADRTGDFVKDLAGATNRLTSATSIESVRSTMEALLATTRTVEASNRALKAQLQQSLNDVQKLQENLQTVRAETFIDPLTTLWNRKFYDQSVAKNVVEAHRRGTALSLVAIDIDHFKKFNDTYGHLTGDQVLRLVGLSLKQHLKGKDLACRFGGEEFVLILPETSLKAATAVAEHIRRLVMGKELIKKSSNENLGRVTLSLGVASLREEDTVTSLYERADQCLYAAKRSGRNKVVCESDPEMSSHPPKAA